MTSVRQGGNFTAKRCRSGVSSRGAWELITFSDNNGRNEITIWVMNTPSGVKEGQQFHIDDIIEVKFGMKKNTNDRWQPQCSIDAVVTAIESEFDAGMSGAGDVNWQELGEADDPWANINPEDQLPL